MANLTYNKRVDGCFLFEKGSQVYCKFY